MSRRTTGEVIFWGASAMALALYCITMPEGLPWNPSAGGRVWRHLVAMAEGSAVALACVAAAGAAGLLGALVNRYLGWRVGMAAAIAWIFMPGVWNGAVTGGRGVVLAAAIVAVAWTGNAVALWVFRKARAVSKAERDGRGGDGMSGAHEAEKRRSRVNRIAGWATLGVAGLFAAASSAVHDYRIGEAASEYARLVAEEAGERVILMNGVCDEQIAEEVKVKGEGEQRSALSLKDTDANRSNVVAFAKREFPGETNLWMEAAISPAAFGVMAARAHPDRFYAMTGKSTTPEKWSARWEAMRPYLKSRDRFVPAMRRAFAYEGNCIGNVLQERGDLKAAWEVYYRVFTEIHPDNPAACVNLNGMLKRGYRVDESTRQRVESARADYEKLLKDRRKALLVARQISHYGPVMRDRKEYEALRERVRKRMEELAEKGGKPVTIPGLKRLGEWNGEMMKAFQARDFDKAARIARAILSRREWRGFVPANMVLGEKMMMEGDWVAAEMLLRVAVAATGPAAPSPMVVNDYAETLRQLRRYDEAEKHARDAVAKAKDGVWVCRLTLAQVLRDGKGRSAGDGEIRQLVGEVLKHAPKDVRERVRREFSK